LPAAPAAEPAGPVAQWLEPAAHNGLVAGSSPAGPTNEISNLSSAISSDRNDRSRYVRFSFAGWVAPGDFVDGIGQIVGMVMAIGVEQHLKRHSEIARCLPRIRASLHKPSCCGVSKCMRGDSRTKACKPHGTLERRPDRGNGPSIVLDEMLRLWINPVPAPLPSTSTSAFGSLSGVG
jgi:hypothetical protein